MSLEQRVTALEKQMAVIHSQQGTGPGKDDWRDTIGMFSDDPDMLEIFADAMKLRETDRKRARKKTKKTQRVQS